MTAQIKTFEIYSKDNTLIETVSKTLEGFDYLTESTYPILHDAVRDVTGRAFEVRGVAFERRNPNWLECAHSHFDCNEISDVHNFEFGLSNAHSFNEHDIKVCEIECSRHQIGRRAQSPQASAGTK